MTIPTQSWDETSPAGSQAISLGDDRIRELKTQIREVINVDHDFPSSGQASDNGQHKKVTLQEQANLGTGAEGTTILGSQTSGGKGELFYTDEDDNDIQITNAGKINGASVGTTAVPATGGGTGQTTIAQGEILYGSAANVISKLGVGTAGMFLKTLGAAANPAWAYAPVVKTIQETYDLSTASGTQAITGVGFTPRIIYFFCCQNGNARMSIGWSESVTPKHNCLYFSDTGAIWTSSTSTSIVAGSSGNQQVGYVSTFGADGFTITWVKSGTLTGTLNIFAFCIQ